MGRDIGEEFGAVAVIRRADEFRQDAGDAVLLGLCAGHFPLRSGAPAPGGSQSFLLPILRRASWMESMFLVTAILM